MRTGTINLKIATAEFTAACDRTATVMRRMSSVMALVDMLGKIKNGEIDFEAGDIVRVTVERITNKDEAIS